jgi:hypothetical protein
MLFVAILTTAIQAQDTTTRKLSSFAGVHVSGNISVDLIASNEHKAEIKMIKGDESDIITEVKGGTLSVKTSNKWKFGRSNAKAEIKLYYTLLDEIESSAGSIVFSNEVVKGRSMIVAASSGSTTRLKLEAQRIDADSSSGATLSISGKAQNVKLEASSGSTIEAINLECAVAEASVSSGSSINTWPTKKLIADASSGGSIKYKGEPESVEKNVGSGGSVKKRG